MDVNARRKECDVKIHSGRKTIRAFPSPPPLLAHRAFSFCRVKQTHALRFARDKKKETSRKEKRKQKKRDGGEIAGMRGRFRRDATCLRSFTLTFSDTSNLFRRNGKWNIFEVPRRPLANRYSSRVNQLYMSAYLLSTLFCRKR